MTLIIQLTPQLERELASQAGARGMDVPSYAARLLEQAAHTGDPHQRDQSLSEFLMESPLAGSELNLEREKDPGRTIEL